MYKDLSLGKHSVRFGGKDSKRDMGLILTDFDGGEVRLKTVDVDIPFSNKPLTFDFSEIYGGYIYEPRYPQAEFVLAARSAEEWDRRFRVMSEWFLRQPRGRLIVSSAPDLHFNARCQTVTVTEMLNDHVGRITVGFKADPFRMSEDHADIPWDMFSFDHDYMNADTIEISNNASIEFYSFAGRDIIPTLSFSTLTAGGKLGVVILNGRQISGISRASSIRFKQEDFVVRPGRNMLRTIGSGRLVIDLVEEVF